MTAIQKLVHIGTDGVLRLEIPVDERDRDVLVTLTVKDANGAMNCPTVGNGIDAETRDRLSAAGIRMPAPGAWNARLVAPLISEGSPVSEALVEDRR